MIINTQTNVHALLEAEPWLLEGLVAISPAFDKLRNPLFRNTMARMASLELVAGFAGLEPGDLVRQVRQKVLAHIIQGLHEGQDVARAKARFADLIVDLEHAEIAAMEEALIQGGMPVTEVQRLCGVHAEVFRQSLDQKPALEIPFGHPLEIFVRENEALREVLARMDDLLTQSLAPACPSARGEAGPGDPSCSTCGVAPEDEEYLLDQERFRFLKKDFLRLADWLGQVDHHYQRKENQLFPVLEAHGITGPSQVMWGVDNEIRDLVKRLRQAVEAGDAGAFVAVAGPLQKEVTDMIYKEEQILFPLCFQHFDDADWARVASGEAGLGYGLASPKAGTDAHGGARQGLEGPGGAAPRPEGGSPEPRIDPVAAPGTPGALIPLLTGGLSLTQLQAVLCLLPVDISFVNDRDEVMFYSDNPERVFPRTPSVIGRKVQFCHPPKSMHLVQKILDDFRSGARAHAEFWINLGGRMIHIQYFAVRDPQGAYLGCLEASQDITRLRALEGEKRLLD